MAFSRKIGTILRLYHKVLLSTAHAARIFFGSRSNRNACFFAFTILQCCKKAFICLYTPADKALKTKQVYRRGCHTVNDIDALRISEQTRNKSEMRLKIGKKLRQCLLHRPGFQHLISAGPAAAVVFFCCSFYYLSGWHRCPNPNSNNKILEKKKDF